MQSNGNCHTDTPVERTTPRKAENYTEQSNFNSTTQIEIVSCIQSFYVPLSVYIRLMSAFVSSLLYRLTK